MSIACNISYKISTCQLHTKHIKSRNKNKVRKRFELSSQGFKTLD